jgi:hypothetical protein
MSVTFNQSAKINANGAAAVSGQWQDVANNDLQINQVIAANQTNKALGIVFNGANLQSLLLVSTQPVTLKINSTTAPAATIDLKAGIPFQWSASAGYFSNPLNVNVTEIYATTTAAAQLSGHVGTD